MRGFLVATHADIQACLGSDAAQYATNKHKGGSSGNKGTRYEDFFIANKVVEAAAQLIELPMSPDPHIQGQHLGFVDDLRIAWPARTHYFQLKNACIVTWLTGEHPIATDFHCQKVLSEHCAEPDPHTSLVVSTSTLADSLAANMPAHIQDHTSVEHFPWHPTINRLVMERPALQGQLAELTHIEQATLDALSGTFGAVLMSCLQHPGGATVREIMVHASRMFPGQLRLLPPTENWENHLLPEFKRVLDAIQGLSYGASRGFFHWMGFGTSGVFGSSVLSEAFQEFQRNIIQTEPTTFEAFEEALP
jgi:hypothetical protein